MKFKKAMATLFQSSPTRDQFSEPKSRGGFKLFGKKKKAAETPAIVAPPSLPPLNIGPAKLPATVVETKETAPPKREAAVPRTVAKRPISGDIDYELRQHLKNEGISFLAFADFGETSALPTEQKSTSRPVEVSRPAASTTASAPAVVEAPKSKPAEIAAPVNQSKDGALENLRNFYLRGKKSAAPAPAPAPAPAQVAVTPPRRESLPPPSPKVEEVLSQPVLKSSASEPVSKVPELKKPVIPRVHTTPPTPQQQPEQSSAGSRKLGAASESQVAVNGGALTVEPSSGKLQKRRPGPQQASRSAPMPERSNGPVEPRRKSPDFTLTGRDSGKFVDGDSGRNVEGESNGFLRPDLSGPNPSQRRSPSPTGRNRMSSMNGRPMSNMRSNSDEKTKDDGLLRPGMPSHRQPRRAPPPDLRVRPPGPPQDGRQSSNGPYPSGGPGQRTSPTRPNHGSPTNRHSPTREMGPMRPRPNGFPDQRHSHAQGSSSENPRRSKTLGTPEKRASNSSTESSQGENSDFTPRNVRRRTIDLPVPVMLPPDRAYTPAISDVQSKCADSHRFTVHCPNVHHRIACMVCRTDSSSERYLCSYCALRFCGRCKSELSKDASIEQIREKAIAEDWASQAPSNSSPVATVNIAWEMACNLDGSRSRGPPRIRQPPPRSSQLRGGPRGLPPNRSDPYLPAMRGPNSISVDAPPRRNESFNNLTNSTPSSSRSASMYVELEGDRLAKGHRQLMGGMHNEVRSMLAAPSRSSKGLAH